MDEIMMGEDGSGVQIYAVSPIVEHASYEYGDMHIASYSYSKSVLVCNLQMDPAFVRDRIAEEGVGMLRFNTVADAAGYVRYVSDHVKCDLLDLSVRVDAAPMAAYEAVVAQIRHVFPVPRKRKYVYADGQRSNFYADGKKVVGVTVVKDTIRVFGVGEYASVLRDIMVRMYRMPLSLSAAKDDARSVAPEVVPARVYANLNIVARQPKPYLYLKKRPSYMRLHRMDVAVDVSKSSMSFHSVATAMIDAKNLSHGRAPSVNMLGNIEYGRSLYVGKRTAMNQWCLYEKSKQSKQKYHRNVHTRVEFRYRPKRVKNFVPEIAAFMSPTEVFFQSRPSVHIAKYLQHPYAVHNAEADKLLAD